MDVINMHYMPLISHIIRRLMLCWTKLNFRWCAHDCANFRCLDQILGDFNQKRPSADGYSAG